MPDPRSPSAATSYMLFDRESGNAIDSYTDAGEAQAALRRAVEAADTFVADLLVLIPFDAEGMPCADSVTFADLPRSPSAASNAKGSAVLVCVDPVNPSERGAMWEGPFCESDGAEHHMHPIARAWALWESIKEDWPGMLPSVIANERAKNLAAAYRMESLGFDYAESLHDYETEAVSDA